MCLTVKGVTLIGFYFIAGLVRDKNRRSGEPFKFSSCFRCVLSVYLTFSLLKNMFFIALQIGLQTVLKIVLCWKTASPTHLNSISPQSPGEE